eukprot:gnl/TRDRNA2_/TRDRNA2_81724_c0_seq1.p1 gnl/TRDRNA2_/TRDRNA2_81724_c0~~gnl/TRDRNA2_/TRDRNA2_81724_c0_seq1.p1  ORF type:complete len:392 (+),score=59.69 gnl/TRDRNA2_/TRDRNA2_81724_c0_seq1:113-1288(+)
MGIALGHELSCCTSNVVGTSTVLPSCSCYDKCEESPAAASSAQAHSRSHLETGTYTAQGWKRAKPTWTNQDSYLVVPLDEARVFVGVFDGHGEHGHNISQHVRDRFFEEVCNLVQGPVLPEALSAMFAKVQESLSGDEKAQYSGTTTVAAVLDLEQGSATVAHVGDSRLVVGSGGAIWFKTEDHFIGSEDEARIVANGGEVRTRNNTVPSAKEAVRRVYKRGTTRPGLAMARALGDLEAQKVGVLSEPEISDNVTFGVGYSVIVGSDGLWAQMPMYLAVRIVEAAESATAAAQCMVEEARARWPLQSDIDDITAVVVKALPGNAPGDGRAQQQEQQERRRGGGFYYGTRTSLPLDHDLFGAPRNVADAGDSICRPLPLLSPRQSRVPSRVV